MAGIEDIIKQTPFVIVGGVATQYYVPQRQTQDIDILVLTQNASPIERELDRAGSRKIGSLAIGGSAWQLPDGTYLDVIESNKPWVKEAIQKPNRTLEGLPIISLPYLVLMKLEASRFQDAEDINKILGVADESTLKQVRAVVRTYLKDAIEDLESFIQLAKLEFQRSQRSRQANLLEDSSKPIDLAARMQVDAKDVEQRSVQSSPKREEWEKVMLSQALKSLQDTNIVDGIQTATFANGKFRAILHVPTETLSVVDENQHRGTLYKTRKGEAATINEFTAQEKERFLQQQSQQNQSTPGQSRPTKSQQQQIEPGE